MRRYEVVDYLIEKGFEATIAEKISEELGVEMVEDLRLIELAQIPRIGLTSKQEEDLWRLVKLAYKDLHSGAGGRTVMDDRGELEGSLLKMLTAMGDFLSEDTIVTMVTENCGRLHLDSLEKLIQKAIPKDINEVDLDPLKFGNGECGNVLRQIYHTVENDTYNAVHECDQMIAAALHQNSLRPPNFCLVILILYQEWSLKWHEENPEDEDSDSASLRSRSPDAHDMDLSSLVHRGRSEPGHGSRGHSRQPSEGPSGGYARTPSRPPPGAPPRARSRDSRGRRGLDSDGKMSNVSDLLLRMKMMHSLQF